MDIFHAPLRRPPVHRLLADSMLTADADGFAVESPLRRVPVGTIRHPVHPPTAGGRSPDLATVSR